MNKPAVASELIDYLNARIFSGAYEPGGRIPSVRALMRKFNLSYGSTLNGLNYLCEHGVLEKHPQSGITVSRLPFRMPGDTSRCIGVVTNGSRPHPGLGLTALTEIQQSALSQGFPLLAAACPLDADLSDSVISDMRQLLSNCRAVIITVEFDNELRELPFDAPAVGIFYTDDFGGRMSIVNLDPYKSAEQAVAYFQRHGRKRVHILSDPRSTYRQRGQIFEYLWRDSGGINGDFVIAPYWKIPPCDFKPEDGYLFTSDNHLQHYANDYRWHHDDRDLPPGLCFLGLDGKNLLIPEFDHYPTIAVDWRAIGRVAFEEAVARLQDPLRPARRIYLAGELIES